MKPATCAQPRRAAAAAFIGTMIEWYDFYIYATAAALVFGALFFPSVSARWIWHRQARCLASWLSLYLAPCLAPALGVKADGCGLAHRRGYLCAGHKNGGALGI